MHQQVNVWAQECNSVARLLDVMEDRDYAYLCLELCNGPNMEQVLEVRQKAWEAAFLVNDCSSGLFAEVRLCVLGYCKVSAPLPMCDKQTFCVMWLCLTYPVSGDLPALVASLLPQLF